MHQHAYRVHADTERSILGCSFFYCYNVPLNYFNYFTEIEDTFIRRRGKNLFLSPLDWALIEAWQDRGIPMHIVIRAIESVFDVFDQQPQGTRTIKSLFYCREEVESQYLEWQRSQVGGHGDTTETTSDEYGVDAIKAHILTSIAKLEAIDLPSLADGIGRAVIRLRQLEADIADDPETADGTFSDIEKMLERELRENLDVDIRKTAEKETTAELRQYKAEMTPEAYKNTFDLMLVKRLRETTGVPRLGLYYL